MRTNNYIIEYTCWGHDGVVLSTGLMRVKNRINTIDAREYFVKYLVKRYGNYGELQIKGCWMEGGHQEPERKQKPDPFDWDDFGKMFGGK